MQLSNVLHILLGAALVSVGVLVTALADRVRGLRSTREAAARMPAVRTPIAVVEPAEPRRAPRAESSRAPVATNGGEDVIAALVAAGYKKPIAADAAWACTAGERATIEGWTAAALRRCARGGMS